MKFSKSDLISIMASANEQIEVPYQIDYKTITNAAYALDKKFKNSKELLESLKVFSNVYVGPFYDYNLDPILASMVPEGHPMSSASDDVKKIWIDDYLSSAPPIKGLVASVFSSNLNYVEEAHAWKRLEILTESGIVSDKFIAAVKEIANNAIDWSEE